MPRYGKWLVATVSAAALALVNGALAAPSSASSQQLVLATGAFANAGASAGGSVLGAGRAAAASVPAVSEAMLALLGQAWRGAMSSVRASGDVATAIGVGAGPVGRFAVSATGVALVRRFARGVSASRVLEQSAGRTTTLVGLPVTARYRIGPNCARMNENDSRLDFTQSSWMQSASQPS